MTLTPRIKAFGVYQALFHGAIVAVLLMTEGSFTEHLARSWLLITVFSLNPNLFKPFWLSVLLFTPYVVALVSFYSWFAYGHLGLEGDDPLHINYLAGVLIFLFGMAGCSNWFVSRIFGVSPSNIFGGSSVN